MIKIANRNLNSNIGSRQYSEIGWCTVLMVKVINTITVKNLLLSFCWVLG